MRRQVVRTDWKRGVVEHGYEDLGPGRARPSSAGHTTPAGGGVRFLGTKNAPSTDQLHRLTRPT